MEKFYHSIVKTTPSPLSRSGWHDRHPGGEPTAQSKHCTYQYEEHTRYPAGRPAYTGAADTTEALTKATGWV
jgi:hypothetical protein